MLLGREGSAEHPQQAAVLVQAAAWQRSRLWTSPVANYMLAATQSQHRACLFEAHLLAPGLSFLWDRQLNGRPVLPGTALLEMAQAAVQMLAGIADQPPPGAASRSMLLLQDCSIPAPVMLSAAAAAMQLQLEAGLGDGSLVVRSMQARTTHLAGCASQCSQARSHVQYAAAARSGLSLAVLLTRAAPAAPSAFQTGSLAIEPRAHIDGFCSHPAVVDSSLHLGASLDQPAAGVAATIRVPVGIKALAAGSTFQPHAAEAHAAGRLHNVPTAQGPATSSYAIWQGAAPIGAAAVVVSELEARPIKLPTATKAQLFPAAAVAATHHTSEPQAAAEMPLLYEVCRQVYSQVDQQGSGALLASRSCFQLVMEPNGSGASAQRQLIPCGGTAGDAAAPLSRLLAHLQQAASGQTSGASLVLASCGGMQHGGSLPPVAARPAAAAAWGMVRVAASEMATMRWAAVDLDSQAAGSQMQTAVDVAGSFVSANAVLRPMLLPCAAGQAAGMQSAPAVAAAGMVLVTGGLGGEH